MSYLRIPRGRLGMSGKYQSRYIEVPLADELFECIQGPFGAYIQMPVENGIAEYRYHTYDIMMIGEFEDPDVEVSLRLAFEEYLRRLRAATPVEGKPKLFWRFRKGEHIQIEAEVHKVSNKRTSRVKLRTRLVVPSCTLAMCLKCLHTEGEPHTNFCENLVRSEDGTLPQP